MGYTPKAGDKVRWTVEGVLDRHGNLLAPVPGGHGYVAGGMMLRRFGQLERLGRTWRNGDVVLAAHHPNVLQREGECWWDPMRSHPFQVDDEWVSEKDALGQVILLARDGKPYQEDGAGESD